MNLKKQYSFFHCKIHTLMNYEYHTQKISADSFANILYKPLKKQARVNKFHLQKNISFDLIEKIKR